MPDAPESMKIRLVQAESELQGLEDSKKDGWELVAAMDGLAALYRLHNRLPEALNLELRSSREKEKIAVRGVGQPAANLSTFGVSTEFDGLRLIEMLGDGASAMVFRAIDERKDESVAVKVFKQTAAKGGPEASSRPEHIKKFEKESTTLRKLDCPNIVSVYGLGTTPEGAPYIVMQYVRGQSIKFILEASEVFNANRTISITRDICRALSAAHAQNVIHRDLKPSNIIVDEKYGAKVVDFGIAKAMGIDAIDATITQVGAIVGSPAYMSPEQCLGEPVDARSDIYSLGCTMFEMLTGIRAFAAETTVQAIAKQINPDRSAIKKTLHSSRVAPKLEAVIMRCLDRDAKNRYQSVAELDHDLSSLQLNKLIAAETNEHANKYAMYAPMAVVSLTIILVAAAVTAMLSHPRPIAVKSDPPPVIGMQIPTSPVAPPVVVPPAPVAPSRPNIIRRTIVPVPPRELIEKRRGIDLPARPGARGWKIMNRYTNRPLFEDPEARDLKDAVQDAVGAGISLHQANLEGADLHGLRLTGGNLSEAVLTGARLGQSHLINVNLENAQLSSAELGQANMVNSNLKGADFRFCNMSQFKAPGSTISGANFSFARMTQAVFPQVTAVDAVFKSAEMIQTQFEGANLRGANFDGARLIQTSFRMADLSNARFGNNQSLSQVHVQGATLTNTFLPNLEVDRGMYLQQVRTRPSSNINKIPRRDPRLDPRLNQPRAVVRTYE